MVDLNQEVGEYIQTLETKVKEYKELFTEKAGIARFKKPELLHPLNIDKNTHYYIIIKDDADKLLTPNT